MTQQDRDEQVAAAVHEPIEARVARDGATWTLVMRRHFRHRPALLWRMLTEPELLVRWSPIVPDRALTTPGPATSRENHEDDPVDTEVLAVEAPRELVHRWGADVMRWTITPAPDGAVLELRQQLGDRASAAALAAGWQVCLGRLATEDGSDRERATGRRAMAYGWQELHDRYRTELSE
ncbi:SRPBCC domain-containing protein [Cellulomonas sp. JH27-2]|uniref:SRPBCC domain-containing protein n=1 Tax=Cellulomonas sp. JH27-2 TaxID=2774139 RepID=UPI0017804A56|nr:SRPBCC domain-containing protein [Cellulomonas sp. JH27-2]MBD8060011.1 SRPBCC domain-containing protein [Cellulomonas sp. JH27-2]